MKNINQRRRALFSSAIPLENSLTSFESHSYMSTNDETASVASHMMLQTQKSVDFIDFEYEQIFLNPEISKFKLFTSNPLFTYAFGYNRIVYLEPKQLYLITSAYYKSVVSIDRAGVWIEKRNPNGLLKCPWSICIDQLNNIYVGDNEAKCIFVFDQNLKYLRTFGENLSNGFFDIVIDDKKNILYSVNLYDSELIGIEINRNEIKKKSFISAPSFISLLGNYIVVLTATDMIYLVFSETLEVKLKFDIKKSIHLSALFTYKENIIFIAAHELLNDKSKSRNTCLCIIKVDEDLNFSVKKIHMETDQVNDMAFTNNSMVSISDTHVAVFNFKNIDALFDWGEIC